MVGRIIGYVVAAGVVFVAVLFILGGGIYLCSASAPGVDVGSRATFAIGLLVVGIILMVVGVVIIWVIRTRGPAPIQQITQQVDIDLDMPGDVSADKLKCQSCGGELSKDHVSLVQGAVMISCPYCGSTYQLTEEPKW
jgi:DNA-directed RNA polymerase subunit RPC12/RpoP